MEKIDIGYTNIEGDLHNRLMEFIDGKKFIWAFRAMSTNVGLYPIIVDGEDAFLIRTKSGRGEILEIADSFKIINVIIKRETDDTQWLDDDEINKVKGFLKDTEKYDVTHLLKPIETNSIINNNVKVLKELPFYTAIDPTITETVLCSETMFKRWRQYMPEKNASEIDQFSDLKGSGMTIIQVELPKHYANHKNNRIRKKWEKKYTKVKNVFTNCELKNVNGDVNIDQDISFTGKLTVTPEMKELAKTMIYKRKNIS
jgi:hypothetical protein